MNSVTLRHAAPGLIVAALLAAATSFAAPQPAATLELQYQQSDQKVLTDGNALFGHYLGTGTGVATGALQGTVQWDLYEDQSLDDLHPAHFRGFVERAGKRYPFQILGVYTPDGTETVVTPAGHETIRYWSLSGTIVFEDDALLGVRHAPVTGSVDTSVGTVRHTVWMDHDGGR